MESVIRKHENATVVGLEVIDLFAEHGCPEVFADELYSIERVGAGGKGESGCETA